MNKMKNFTDNQTFLGKDNQDVRYPQPEIALSTTLNVTVVVLTSVGNGFVCVAYHKYYRLRTPTNALLVTMAYCSLFTVVSAVLRLAGDVRYPNEGSPSLCMASGSISLIVNIMIVHHLCAISADRLLAVKFSLRYCSIITHTRVLSAILVIWLLGFLYSMFTIVVIVEFDLVAYMKEKQHTCQSYWAVAANKVSSRLVARILAIFSIIVLNVIPFLVIIFCHFYIWRQSLRHSKNIKSQRKAAVTKRYAENMRSTKTIFLVIGAFVVSYFPILVAVFLEFIFLVDSILLAAFLICVEAARCGAP